MVFWGFVVGDFYFWGFFVFWYFGGGVVFIVVGGILDGLIFILFFRVVWVDV